MFPLGETDGDDEECDDENHILIRSCTLAHDMLSFSTHKFMFLLGEDESNEQERRSPRQSQCKVGSIQLNLGRRLHIIFKIIEMYND